MSSDLPDSVYSFLGLLAESGHLLPTRDPRCQAVPHDVIAVCQHRDWIKLLNP